ncbi:MAG: nucleotide exchange factor GrpE [Chloroflexota bacterium]
MTDTIEMIEAKVVGDDETAAIETGAEAETAKIETPAETEAEAVAGAAAAVEPQAPDLAGQLELARQEAAQNFEGWQRAAAELANYKRRQEEQLKLQRDRIKGEVLEGIISALDDMDLAFQNVPAELDGQLVGWVEGFRLVQRKLNKVLEDQNVMLVNTGGQFDPNFHEAISYEESEAHQEGQIIAELRKGYQIGSRVLRPALVRVAK